MGAFAGSLAVRARRMTTEAAACVGQTPLTAALYVSGARRDDVLIEGPLRPT
jgi:hypothetical protein